MPAALAVVVALVLAMTVTQSAAADTIRHERRLTGYGYTQQEAYTDAYQQLQNYFATRPATWSCQEVGSNAGSTQWFTYFHLFDVTCWETRGGGGGGGGGGEPTPPPEPFDCGDGLLIARDEVADIVGWVAASTDLAADERAALEAQPCSFPAFFDGVEEDLTPPPAEAIVAGDVAIAPIGRFAAPSRDGSGACPLYRREVKLTLGQGFQYRTGGGSNAVQRVLDWMWRRLGNSGQAPTQFATGDVIATLKLSVRVCTDGERVTAVDPPAGGSPDYEAIVTPKGQLVGYAPPDGVLAQSHNYIDADSRTTFKSRVQAGFTYTSPAGIELPVEFRAKTFAAEITVYRDGTWDYATSGGGVIGGG